METVPFCGFPYEEVSDFHEICSGYPKLGAFHVEGRTQRKVSTCGREVIVRHYATGVKRIYPGDSKVGWLGLFEWDILKGVFDGEESSGEMLSLLQTDRGGASGENTGG